ncbi:MAG TPA: hypothetical protein VGI57_04105 [Usitatibacter sp.]
MAAVPGRTQNALTKPSNPFHKRPNNMFTLQTIGPHLALIVIGIVLFSLTTAIIALLADY